MRQRRGKNKLDRFSPRAPAGRAAKKKPVPPCPGELEAEIQRLHEELALERQLKDADLDNLHELEAACQNYADLYDFAPLGYADLDRAGVLRNINLTGSRMLGQNREDLVGRPLLPLIAESSRHKWLRHLTTLRREASATVELEMEVPGSGRRLLRFHSARLVRPGIARVLHAALRTAFIDITAQRQAEGLAQQRLTEIEDLYRNAPVGLGMLDAELRYLRVNHKLAEIHGVPADLHIGRRFRELLPGLADQIETGLRSVLETGHPRIGVEIAAESLAEPGVQRNLLESWLPIRNDSGHIAGLSIVVEDITERKRTEIALREAKEAAEAASRAKDSFLATLSHELRTPLTPVLMLSQQLERDATLPADAREDLTTIRQNIQFEARLIDDLLDLTRIARGKIQLRREPVDVHRLLRQAVKTCREGDSIGQGLKIEWQLEAASSCISADPTRMEQVFWNIINNAIKFTQPVGSITIRTANAPLPASPDRPGPDLGRLWIQITDTGVGIAPDKLTAIFNSFEQGGARTTARYGGLGLGLAIAKAVTEMHGGTITAASDGPGHGATFIVALATIPAPQELLAHSAGPLSIPEEAPESPPLRLLLVEDHQATAFVLQRLFDKSGWRTTHAATVKAALEIAAREPIDLVVSDLGLPDGNGHDLMRQLHDQYGLSGIALSGFGMDQDIQKSLASGFILHLTKPVNFDELRAAIALFRSELAHERHLTPA